MTESTVGRSIGPYELVELIDETGSSLVYKGFQPTMSRYVAVKVLKPHAARDAAAVQRFTQQGELMARIQHSNILPVYDMGQQEGVVYRASRFAEGGSLQGRMGAYVDPREALGLIAGITEGLEYIHGQGYVHGNLKPANILLDEERRPLLTDFGLAAQPGAPPTPYLSPEQVQGGAVDRRTDVYALGVLLYEMLIGQPPAAGTAISVRARRPDLPAALEPVMLKAMATNPDHRYQSASALRNALDAALRPAVPLPQPVAPPPAPAPQPETKRGTNWPAIILGGGLIVVLIVVGLLLVSQLGEEPPAAEPPATDVPIEVTAVVPTHEPQPTEVPAERPTQPPEPEAPPTAPPPEEAPPEAEHLPAEGEESGGSPDRPICGSTIFAGGLVVLSGGIAFRKGRSAKRGSKRR